MTNITDPHFETVQKDLKNLIEIKKGKENIELNEAETRFFFIDKIIKEVMGWPDRLRLEVPQDKERFDYLLSSDDGSNKMIIEAKKEGVYFNLQAKKKKIVSVNTFKNSQKPEEKSFYDAVKQAVGYARRNLAPFAMITNGHQVAVVLSNIMPGFPEEYGNALVFHSLEDIQNRLSEFLGLLSFSALNVSLPELHKVLLKKSNYYSSSFILKNSILDYPRPHLQKFIDQDHEEMCENVKNVSGAIVHGIASKAFEEQKMEEFLTECYIMPTEYKRYESDGLKTGRTFTKEFENEFNIQIEPAAKKSKINLNLLTSTAEDPVIVLGNVGVGKSIFIDYLIFKEKKLKKSSYLARIRFTDVASFDDATITKIVAEEIYNALKRDGYDCTEDGILRDIYRTEISELRKNFKGASEETIAKKIGDLLIRNKSNTVSLVKDALRIIKTHDKKIIVFLDDIDQKASHIQREIYTLARELMRSWGVHLSIITMTPSAFHLSRNDITQRGPKSTGHTRIYSIIAPPITMVLERRLKFVQKLITEKRLREYGYEFEPDKENSSKYLSTLLSVLKPKEDVGRIVAHLSGDNTRRATDIVESYVQSKNTIIGSYNPVSRIFSPTTAVSRRQFLISILKGDFMDYDDEKNEFIINIFFASTNDPREHFLSLGILHKLSTSPPEGGKYHLLNKIRDWAMKYSFNELQIREHVQRLANYELIEPVDLNSQINESDMAKSYRIKPRGQYHIELASEYTYVAEMLKVTPIFFSESQPDIDTENKIIRVENVNKFYQYLMKVKREQAIDNDFIPPNILDKMRKSIEFEANKLSVKFKNPSSEKKITLSPLKVKEPNKTLIQK